MMEGFVHEHRFKVGQSVSFTFGPFGRDVTQLLPHPRAMTTSTGLKNGDEPHERVIRESQLDGIA